MLFKVQAVEFGKAAMEKGFRSHQDLSQEFKLYHLWKSGGYSDPRARLFIERKDI